MNKRNWMVMLLSGTMLLGCSGSSDDDDESTTTAGIAEAKAMVEEARTIAESTDDLQQPMDLFGQQITDAGTATEQARECVGSQLGGLSQAIADCFSGFADPDDDGVLTYNGPISCQYQTAGADQTPKTAGIAISAGTPAGHDTVDVDGSVGDSTVDLQMVVPRDSTPTNNAVTILSATMAGTIESVACGATQVRLTLGDTEGPAGIVLKKVASPQNDPENPAGDLDEADIRGSVKLESLGGANPVAIIGEIEAGALRCTSAACIADGAVFNPDVFRVEGSVGDADEEQAVALEWTMSNARQFNPLDPVSSANFVEASASLAADVALAGQPASAVTVTVNLEGATDPAPGDSSGAPFGNVTAEVQRATMVVTIVVENSVEAPDEIERIVVSNEHGAQMVLRPREVGNVIGEITVDGVKVANVEKTGNGVIVIRYVDGTFETLT